MKHVVQEILEGNFRTGNTSLNFSCPRIDLTVSPDSFLEGSFTVYGPEGLVTEGRVISSDLCMECLTPEFSGIQDEIYYRVDTTGMKLSDTVKGSFYIESNQGEYYLPFSVTINRPVIDSALGEIRNLFHFINLAKTNWDEAVTLFYSPEFKTLLTGNDAQYYTAYKGLSAVRGNEHNVEEFLLGTGKKKPIEYIPDKNRIEMTKTEDEQRYALIINRNGWGCTRLEIEAEGDFLRPEKELAQDDDFLGNTYRLYYYIDNDKLHAGKNYGRLRLRSFEKTVDIPVIINRGTEDIKRKHRIYMEKKQVTLKLMKYYQAYRAKKLGGKTWMEETDRLIERLKELDGQDLATDLFQAQLLMAKERYHEAKWLLEQNRIKIEALGDDKTELRCYYIYLSTLCSRDEAYIEAAEDKLFEIYNRNRGNWRIAWLLLFLSHERVNSPARKWALLEEAFSYGCTSPMIYMEAWNLLSMNPAALLRLGVFELQILTYAVKNDVMKDDVLIQLLYLAKKQKGYSRALLRILILCYEKRQQDDVLLEICSQLIKGNKYGGRYLKWYREGVEKNLRITRLYEYYMMSVPADSKETLPKAVLMYFSYQCDLSCETAACLYAYVHKRREEFPEIYLSYVPAMESFVQKQAKAGRITKELAYLYRNILTQSMVDSEMAQNIMNMLFVRNFTIESDDIKNIIVVYPYADREMIYPVSGDKAMASVFDKDALIMLEDAGQNRYINSIPFHMDKLLTAPGLAALAAPFAVNHLGFALHTCYGNRDSSVVNEENLQQFKLLADSDVLTETKRREIRAKLIHFYYEKDRMWELDEYLLSLTPDDIATEDKKEVVRMLTLRGMYKEAYDWVRSANLYEIDAKTLAKLCSRLLAQDSVGEDSLMTALLHYVVKKGKYDENILVYLVKYFNGNIKDMRDIWKAAAEFGIDIYELSERILIQMLYTGAYIGEVSDILASYMRGGGNDDVTSAFLAQSSYDYVIKEKITDSYLVHAIFRMNHEGVTLHLICKLAYLKYYAENKSEINEEIKEVIISFLNELLERRIILPVFKEYQGYLPAMDILQDKSILEYRAKPGNRVSVHYVINKGKDAQDGFIKENMREVFAGICIKEFVLFFGEDLKYYITEDIDGEEKVTISGTIRKSETAGNMPDDSAATGSRFNILNDIMIGRTLHDYDTVDKLLEEYYKKDFLTKRLFKPL